ncbi:hypothetical protein Ancab_020073 [Ancistrocladus abbreviatus]
MSLSEDPLILHKYQLSQAIYATSPLHIASKLGYIEFADKVLCAMPELAGELDSNRLALLHLSCEYGHLEIVRALLNVSPDMRLARDLRGRTLLHLAVIKGRLDHTQLEVLTLLVSEVDDKDILNGKENEGNTILHLAVADKQVEVWFRIHI